MAKHLIFVGMESYFDAPKPAKDDCGHEWLTECRAIEMAERTRNAFPKELRSQPSYWTLDIGAAQTKSQTIEWDQRRAVVLGVRNRKEGLSVEDAVTRLAVTSSVAEVKLKDYTKVQTTKAELLEWGPGSSDRPHR